MKLNKHRCSPVLSRAAFTLIEMLVVIAILALLVSIIVPVTTKALDAARNVKCISNLKQLGVAQMAFASEHDGRFTGGAIIHPGNDYPFGSGQLWQIELLPYLGVSENSAGNYRRDEANFIFNCPLVNPKQFTTLQTSYVLNQFIPNKGRNWLGILSRVENLSGTVLLVEAHPSNSDYSLFVSSAQPTVGSPAFRHRASEREEVIERDGLRFFGNGVANTLFCDGHVESLPPERLQHNPPNSPWWHY